MDAKQKALAQDCLNAAYDKSMDFPTIVGTLINAGFDGYVVDYRCNTTTYFLPDGDHVVIDNPPSEGIVAALFDAAGVAAQIKWAQANPSDYSYKAFCQNMKTAGCASYMVSFSGRRALYIGRTGETHVEHFPQ